jgi:hypothetical protein
MSNPRVIQVILAYKTRGTGMDDDPFRQVTQVFSLEGELIAERDPFLEAKNDRLA